MSYPEIDALRFALEAPFRPDEVKWKPGATNGNRALAMPYVDARVVMDRLDDVLGVGGWQTSYREARDGIVCRLSALVSGNWIVHEDIGGESEQPDDGDKQKAAFSDSLKRAAVHLGVGRYLYRLKPQWVDYDPQKRRLVGTPQLPPEALPKESRPPKAQPATKDAPKDAGPKATPQQMEDLAALKGRLSMTNKGFVNMMQAEFGVSSRIELTQEQAERFLTMLRRLLPKQQQELAGSTSAGTGAYGADAGRL